MKTLLKVIFGLALIGLIVKLLPLGLTIGLAVLLHKKNWLGKKLRITVSIVAIAFGALLTLAINSADNSTTTTTTVTPTATITPKETAPAVEAPKQEAAPKAAPKAPVNIITTINEAEALQHIKDDAKAAWATDYEEQRYVIGEQTKAYNDLKALVIDTAEKEQILNQAHSEWGYDFEETLYVYNEQLKAYNELNQ